MRKITLSLPEEFFDALLDLADISEQTPAQLLSSFFSSHQTDLLNDMHDLAVLQRKTLRLIRKNNPQPANSCQNAAEKDSSGEV